MRLSRRLVRLLRDRLLRRAGLLGGATAAGQGLLLLLTPALTRLYAPADFGHFALFATLAALFLPLVFLRLELSLPLCRGRELPAACSALSVCGLSILALATALSWGGALLLPEARGELRTLLWLSPPALAALAVGLPLSPLFVRTGDFRGYALLEVLRLAGQGIGQLLWGLAGTGSAGLVLGYAGGALVAAAVGWRRLVRFGLVRPPRPRLRLARLYLRRHRDHPLYLAPGALAHAATQFLPAALLALLFDLHLAGLYALAQRLLGAPVRLVAQAVSQALFGELARGEAADPGRRVDRLLALLALAGGLVLALPLLPGESGWAWILGPDWAGFHLLLVLLAPLFLARFLVEAVWNVLVVGGRRLFLAATAAQLAVLLAAYGGAKAAGASGLWAVGLHTAGGVLAALATLLAVRRTARGLVRRETGRVRGPSPAPAASAVLTTGAGRSRTPAD